MSKKAAYEASRAAAAELMARNASPEEWRAFSAERTKRILSRTEQRRTFKAERGACKRCYLGGNGVDCCVCDIVEPLPTKHAVTCFIHASELFKATSTHQLLLRGIRDSELCVWQSTEWPSASHVWEHVQAQCEVSGRTPCILYPAPGAIPAAAFVASLPPEKRARGLHVVVCDGTWNNVGAMVSELPPSAPKVVITPPTTYTLFGPLRGPPSPGRVSTLEAFAFLLDELRVGERAVAAASAAAHGAASSAALVPAAGGEPLGASTSAEDASSAAGEAAVSSRTAAAAWPRGSMRVLVKRDQVSTVFSEAAAAVADAPAASPLNDGAAAESNGGAGLVASPSRPAAAPLLGLGGLDTALRASAVAAAASRASESSSAAVSGAGGAAASVAEGGAEGSAATSAASAAAGPGLEWVELTVAPPSPAGPDFYATRLRCYLMAHVDATLRNSAKLHVDIVGVGYRTWFLTQRAQLDDEGVAAVASPASPATSAAVASSAAVAPADGGAGSASSEPSSPIAKPDSAGAAAASSSGSSSGRLVVEALAGPLLSKLPAWVLVRIAEYAYGERAVISSGYAGAFHRSLNQWGHIQGPAREDERAEAAVIAAAPLATAPAKVSKAGGSSATAATGSGSASSTADAASSAANGAAGGDGPDSPPEGAELASPTSASSAAVAGGGDGGPTVKRRYRKRKPLPPTSAFTAVPLARTCTALYSLFAGRLVGTWHPLLQQPRSTAGGTGL